MQRLKGGAALGSGARDQATTGAVDRWSLTHCWSSSTRPQHRILKRNEPRPRGLSLSLCSLAECDLAVWTVGAVDIIPGDMGCIARCLVTDLHAACDGDRSIARTAYTRRALSRTLMDSDNQVIHLLVLTRTSLYDLNRQPSTMPLDRLPPNSVK